MRPGKFRSKGIEKRANKGAIMTQSWLLAYNFGLLLTPSLRHRECAELIQRTTPRPPAGGFLVRELINDMNPERHRPEHEKTDFDGSAGLSRATDPLLKRPVGYFGWGIPRLDSGEQAAAYLDASPGAAAVRMVEDAIETYEVQGETETAAELREVLQEHLGQYTEPRDPPKET